jgi:hypothetical protein
VLPPLISSRLRCAADRETGASDRDRGRPPRRARDARRSRGAQAARGWAGRCRKTTGFRRRLHRRTLLLRRLRARRRIRARLGLRRHRNTLIHQALPLLVGQHRTRTVPAGATGPTSRGRRETARLGRRLHRRTLLLRRLRARRRIRARLGLRRHRNTLIRQALPLLVGHRRTRSPRLTAHTVASCRAARRRPGRSQGCTRHRERRDRCERDRTHREPDPSPDIESHTLLLWLGTPSARGVCAIRPEIALRRVPAPLRARTHP